MNFKFKNITLILSFLVTSISIFNNSCTHDPVDIALLDTVCFESQIFLLLQSSCGMNGCHTSGSYTRGFNITDYNSIVQSVKAGDPRHSKLYKIITDINSDNMMPPSQPLTKEQRTLIEVWIAQGAQDTKCSK
jgi:hypothetical protein